MSIRDVGSYIGHNRVTSTSQDSASGIWSLAAAERRRRAAAWPQTFPFAPDDLSGLQLWLDASDASTLYDATSGGSLVAADGGVARWEDKSGNGRHATQGTSGSRPLRKTSVQNNRDVIRFDGSNDMLDGGSNTPGTGNERTVFLVHKAESSAGGEVLWIGKRSGSFSDRLFGVRQAYAGSDTTIGGDALITNVNVLNTQLTLTSFHYATWRQVSSTRAVSYWHNGVSQSVSGTPESFSAAGGYTIGALTSGGVTFGYHASDIGEIIVYNTALSDSDRLAVESYLSAKWGIS